MHRCASLRNDRHQSAEVPRTAQRSVDAEAIEIDGRPLIRLHPRRVISFGLDEDREAHEMTFHSRDVS